MTIVWIVITSLVIGLLCICTLTGAVAVRSKDWETLKESFTLVAFFAFVLIALGVMNPA